MNTQHDLHCPVLNIATSRNGSPCPSLAFPAACAGTSIGAGCKLCIKDKARWTHYKEQIYKYADVHISDNVCCSLSLSLPPPIPLLFLSPPSPALSHSLFARARARARSRVTHCVCARARMCVCERSVTRQWLIVTGKRRI